MRPATVANEINYNLGADYSLQAELADFEMERETEDVDAMTTEQRQALNASMFDWFNG